MNGLEFDIRYRNVKNPRDGQLVLMQFVDGAFLVFVTKFRKIIAVAL